MKKLIPISILLFAVSCSGLREPDFVPEKTCLKVLSYNVNWSGRNAHKIIDELNSSRADVIMLQETTPAWEKTLRKQCSTYPFQYYHHSPGAGGIAYLSKTKAIDLKLIKNSEGWFPAYKAVFKTKLGKVQFLNVHLRPPLSDKGTPSLSALYTTKKIRKNEIIAISASLDKNIPTIIGGDFNENDGGRAISHLENKGFTNCLPLYDTSNYTWKWKTSVATLKGRYDHIMYCGALESTAAKVTEVDASDHHPVFAIIIKKDI